MATNIDVKQKEAKTLKFTCTLDGSATDVSGATDLHFGVKRKKSDTTYLIEKENADFNTDNAASGIVRVALSADDLDLNEGNYVAELRITFSSSNIDKSVDLDFNVEKAVIV